MTDKSGTSSTVMGITEAISDSINGNQSCELVFLDLSKALITLIGSKWYNNFAYSSDSVDLLVDFCNPIFVNVTVCQIQWSLGLTSWTITILSVYEWFIFIKWVEICSRWWYSNYVSGIVNNTAKAEESWGKWNGLQ